MNVTALRHRSPEVSVVPEEDARALALQAPQVAQRPQTQLAVEVVRWQAHLVEGSAQVAAIRGQHDIAFGKPDARALMARRMPVAGKDDDRTVAVQVMLALDLEHRVAEIEVRWMVEPVVLGGSRSAHFAALQDDRGVR